jgi:hypothetical protein
MRRELRDAPIKQGFRHHEIREGFGQGQKNAKMVRAGSFRERFFSGQ